MQATCQHAFEKRGLGKAPFRYIGMEHQEISNGQRVIGSVGGCEVTTKPGSTCDYCGAYILNIFRVESADGQTFKVGCDCVCKVGDAGLEKSIKDDVKKMKAQREKDRIDAARVNLPLARSLMSQPHPNAYQASEGKSMWHYCEWLLKNADTAGKLRACRMIEVSIAPRCDD